MALRDAAAYTLGASGNFRRRLVGITLCLGEFQRNRNEADCTLKFIFESVFYIYIRYSEEENDSLMLLKN